MHDILVQRPPSDFAVMNCPEVRDYMFITLAVHRQSPKGQYVLFSSEATPINKSGNQLKRQPLPLYWVTLSAALGGGQDTAGPQA